MFTKQKSGVRGPHFHSQCGAIVNLTPSVGAVVTYDRYLWDKMPWTPDAGLEMGRYETVCHTGTSTDWDWNYYFMAGTDMVIISIQLYKSSTRSSSSVPHGLIITCTQGCNIPVPTVPLPTDATFT